MKRQILVFTPPSAPREDVPSSEALPRRPSSELGRWLTHDLRAKGAPNPSRPPAPIVLPAPDAPDASQTEFARWLTSDLRPRGSSVPPPDSLAPQSPRDSLPPPVSPDSLAPQVWPELDGPRITPVPALDDDDLSVLPGRPRALALFGSRGLRSVAAVGAVLLAFGFFLMRGPENVPGSAERAAAAEVEGAGTSAVLLPPPPPELSPIEPDESVAEDETPRVASQRGTKWPEPAEAVAPATPTDPRWRQGGPSVARFPDLPPPKLSELAREGQQAASERDAAVRKAAKASSP